MSDLIPRINAALEGRYHIERKLGEGGMAIVYLAEDLKHERKVALKVLKPSLAAVVGADRFLAEIKTTAGLQHPHILPLHDSGEADSFLFYVMPFVQGESLRARLDREKQLPVEEAVRIARDVAEALQAAHAHGVIHRDIKPANILLSGGRPLVADFGIALAISAAGGGGLTETGLSMGTPYYMSPEQASADRITSPTTDVYSLGCVLYEMLVGEPPFVGATAQAVLAKILTQDTPTSTLVRPSIPPNVDAAIRKALEKLPADRFRDALSFAGALGNPGFRHGGPKVSAPGDARGPWTPLTIGLAASALVFATAFGLQLLRPTPDVPVARFDITPPQGSDWVTDLPGRVVAIAADGTHLAYVGWGPGGTQIWHRRLDQLEATPIPGTEGGENPVFSPDGQSIAFWANQSLKTVSLLGGRPATVIPEGGVGSRYIAWGDDDMLYYAADVSGQGDYLTFRIPPGGGEPEQVTDPIPDVLRISVPAPLPDGKGTLLTVRRGNDAQATTVGVVGRAGGAVRELFPGLGPQYSASGHIVFATADNAMMAVPFDLDRLEVTGTPIQLLDGVATRLPGMAAHFSISRTGTLVYRRTTAGATARAAAPLRLVSMDLEGEESRLPLEPRRFEAPTWSPDGRSVVYTDGDQLYMYDVVVGSRPRQLTFTGNNRNAVYSPDGSHIVFESTRQGTQGSDLFIKNLTDDSRARPLVTLGMDQSPTQWPSDSVILVEQGVLGIADLGQLDLADPERPRIREYLTSESDLRGLVVSPDGRLAAYVVTESREGSVRVAVHVRSFPEPGLPTIVAETVGRTFAAPTWSLDGRVLYFSEAMAEGPPTELPQDWLFLAARIDRDPVPAVASVDTLFVAANIARPTGGAGLHPDGDRFLTAQGLATDGTPLADTEPDQLVLVQGFYNLLRGRVPD
jgi:serine/threonine-protein kinase